MVERGGGESEGWSGPPSLLLQLQSVSDQLLIHSSFTKTTNRGHTRADAGQEVGRNPSLLSSPFGLTLLLQKESSPSLSFVSPPFSSYLWLISSTCSPLSFLCLSSILLLSPASLEQISSCLSLTHSKCSSYKTGHCSVTAAIHPAAAAAATMVDNN